MHRTRMQRTNLCVSDRPPLVRQDIPDLEVIIAGRNRLRTMLALASRTRA
jgi:hypothetical protein